MRWEKLGLLYAPPRKNMFLQTHAANPVAVHIDGDCYRIFYSGRDEGNKSSVGCVDIDIKNRKIINDYEDVIFTCGDAESFYSHGVSIGNAYKPYGGDIAIPFMGWKIEGANHWYGKIGRFALGDDLMTPISLTADLFMDLDEEDPISLSYPWIVKDNDIYKMWYGSTLTWDAGNGEMVHVIKYATSQDGQIWEKHGLAVPYAVGEAQAFSRPTAIYIDGQWHMWYSYRSGKGEKYRIGYAEIDKNGKGKRMNDKAGIDVSQNGWDSEMICYPFVFRHNEDVYMLYNGNGYGKTGFGLAVLDGRCND